MGGPILPADDAQARYFALCAFALRDVELVAVVGVIKRPAGQRFIEHDVVDRVTEEAHQRGFYFSDKEVSLKQWDFIQAWENKDG